MPGSYTPNRGDIIYTNFDPAAGREQAHNRPALVITIQAFNRHCNLALVAPITTKPKGSGFEVSLNTSKTTGAILCHQIKMIDYQERGVSFIEKAPHDVFSQALAKVRAIVG